MNTSLVFAVLGLAVSVQSSYGLGVIYLDNYTTEGPAITYSPGGLGLGAGWTVGLYYAQGDITGSVLSDPFGFGIPTYQSSSFVLGTGPGSTAAFGAFNTPGQFVASSSFIASPVEGTIITVELVAYNGTDYVSSTSRGHSAPFTMITVLNTSPNPPRVGDFMAGFSIIPEPSVFALTGLWGLCFWIFPRRK